MVQQYSMQELCERVPVFVEGVSQLHTRDPGALAQLLEAVGLVSEERFGTRDVDRRPDALRRYKFLLAEESDVGFERRLRGAVTRKVGKPAGVAKHWDAGRFEIGLNYRSSVSLTLLPRYSLEELRVAAGLWLEGAEFNDWLLEAGLDTVEGIAGGPRPGTPVRTGATPARASIHTSPDKPSILSLLLEPMRRVPGTRPKDDEENYAATLEFLTARLGEPSHPSRPADARTRWVVASREFSVKRLRTYSRYAEFRQDAVAEGE